MIDKSKFEIMEVKAKRMEREVCLKANQFFKIFLSYFFNINILVTEYFIESHELK